MAASSEGIRRARRLIMAIREDLGLDRRPQEKPPHSFVDCERMKPRRINRSPDALHGCRMEIPY